jgi:uncharacterized protein
VITPPVDNPRVPAQRRPAPDGPTLNGPTFNDAPPPRIPWPPPKLGPGPGGGLVLRAVDQFVVKLHGRCNLACDYCYVYELRDTGWRSRPRVMPPAVRAQLAARIAEHIRRHRPPHVRVVLHGGEPLLAGAATLDAVATTLREAVTGARTGTVLHLAVQTNGTLLADPGLLETLRRHRIGVGVSVDGDGEAHDRHRTLRSGAGSHRAVRRGVAALTGPRYRHLFEGVLCTVDTANDPARCYDALLALGPPALDFPLPHATWDHPGPRTGPGAGAGRWLATVYDRWVATGRPVGVRLFEAAESLARGGGSGSELLGGLPAAALVVEPDGSIAWTDALKAVADGAADTGLGVARHSFDEVLALPGAPEHGPGALGAECRACPLLAGCGGGLRAHRHGRGRGFGNPSVYCAELALLTRHVRDRVAPARGAGRSAAAPGAAAHAPTIG